MSLTPLATARDLFAAARAHKREEARQRRLARERMEELRRFCLAHRIAIEELRDGGHNAHGQQEQEEVR